MMFADTIVALSSGRLPAGVAVIRLSGPQCRFAAETIVGGVPAPRVAAYRVLRDSSGDILDKGLVIHIPGPDSFTGEDVLELHVHGGRAVVTAVLEALVRIPGIRHAEPGEFTRRAFLNGKLDLVQSEALADLIGAETEAQRRFALRNASAQGVLYAGWRKRLVHARAMIEAEIDFADEDDVPGSVSDGTRADLLLLAGEMSRHIDQFRSAEIVREGFDVVIVGAPNAGKSSLFNALARRDAAIVSNEPGTTRDLLEVSLDLNGILIRVTDTAGLRENAGTVEAIGIGRARARAGEADLIVVLTDMDGLGGAGLEFAGRPTLRVGTKSDLVAQERKNGVTFDLRISSLTGDGLPELLEEIGARAAAAVQPGGDALPARLRHVELLRGALGHLKASLDEPVKPPEVRAEDLRLVTDLLGRITGAIDVEDLLDVIFSQFCIGK